MMRPAIPGDTESLVLPDDGAGLIRLGIEERAGPTALLRSLLSLHLPNAIAEVVALHL
jgi:hypothetical protein